MMLVALIFHTCVAIWICGSNNVFYQSPDYAIFKSINNLFFGSDDAYTVQGKKNYLVGFFDRALRPHNYILFFLLVLITVSYILMTFLLKPVLKCLSFCTSCCVKEKQEVHDNPFLKQDYMHFIKKNEVNKEVELVKMDIKEYDPKLKPAYKERLRAKKKAFKAHQ